MTQMGKLLQCSEPDCKTKKTIMAYNSENLGRVFTESCENIPVKARVPIIYFYCMKSN